MNQQEVKMIHLRTVKKICKDYTQIENYTEAINDTTQTWICHHILGEILTREQLIAHDFYYDIPPCMLKFVTKSEHNKIHKHHKGKKLTDEQKKKCAHKTKVQYWLGKKRGEEFGKKMSEVQKGRIPWNKGKKGLTYKKFRKITDINNNVTVTSTTSLN